MISKIFATAFSALLAITLAHSHHDESTSEMLLPFAERPSVPVHGNWCGPGHGGSSTSSIPCIDALDCKCKQHDLCWEKHGTLNCKCDNDLVASLKRATSRLEVLIREYFEVSPCKGPVDFPVPKTCRRCVKIFRKRVCAPYPCGFRNVCEIVPIVVKKGSVASYSC